MPCELEEEREREEKSRCLEEREVILVQAVIAARRSDFYIVDLKAEEKLVATPPIRSLLNEGGFGKIAHLGSVLYDIGGDMSIDYLIPKVTYGEYDIHRGASCLDLGLLHLHPLREDDEGSKLVSSNNWKEAPHMNHHRMGHSCVSLGGKLYVVGETASKAEIGKVLDPKLGYWKDLPPPPFDFPQDRCHVTYPVIPDEKNGRLLVHLTNVDSLYAYYPSTATWNCLDQDFTCWCDPMTVLMDDVLYFCCREDFVYLKAYDLSSKTWLKVVYCSNFRVKIRHSFFDAMLNLGNGMLCLCQRLCYNLQRPEPIVTKIWFVKLRVQRTSPEELLVSYDSGKRFPFDGYFEAKNFIRL